MKHFAVFNFLPFFWVVLLLFFSWKFINYLDGQHYTPLNAERWDSTDVEGVEEGFYCGDDFEYDD